MCFCQLLPKDWCNIHRRTNLKFQVYSNLEWCIFDISTLSDSDRLCINENANNSKSNSMFFLSTDKIWNGRKFLHTSWSLRPEEWDYSSTSTRCQKKHRASLSPSNTHIHSCVLMNAPDLFCRNWAHLLLATSLLSSSLFLALIKLPAAPVTNTLLISRLLLAKTLHTKLKTFLVSARATRGAGAKSSHEVMDWEM